VGNDKAFTPLHLTTALAIGNVRGLAHFGSEAAFTPRSHASGSQSGLVSLRCSGYSGV